MFFFIAYGYLTVLFYLPTPAHHPVMPKFMSLQLQISPVPLHKRQHRSLAHVNQHYQRLFNPACST